MNRFTYMNMRNQGIIVLCDIELNININLSTHEVTIHDMEEVTHIPNDNLTDAISSVNEYLGTTI